MNPEWVRERCLALPQATEHVIWGTDLTFKVAGKIFAHLALEPAKVWLAFKVTPEKFYELTERPDIVPAPYMARASYVALQTRDALRPDELATLLRESYELVVARMSRKTQEALSAGAVINPPKRKPAAHVKKAPKESPRKLLSANKAAARKKSRRKASKKKSAREK